MQTFVKTTYWAIAFVSAFIISCSDQDEVPAANQNNTSNSLLQGSGKTHAGARVGSGVYNTQVGDPIDLITAKEWTANYQDTNPEKIKAHFFGSEIIQQILAETGAVGIRIYYALDEKGEQKLLLVGVDSEGNDLLPLEGASLLDGEENTIADYSLPCPSYCSGD